MPVVKSDIRKHTTFSFYWNGSRNNQGTIKYKAFCSCYQRARRQVGAQSPSPSMPNKLADFTSRARGFRERDGADLLGTDCGSRIAVVLQPCDDRWELVVDHVSVDHNHLPYKSREDLTNDHKRTCAAILGPVPTAESKHNCMQ